MFLFTQLTVTLTLEYSCFCVVPDSTKNSRESEGVFSLSKSILKTRELLDGVNEPTIPGRLRVCLKAVGRSGIALYPRLNTPTNLPRNPKREIVYPKLSCYRLMGLVFKSKL